MWMDRRKFCFSLLAAPAIMSSAGLQAEQGLLPGVRPAIWDSSRKTRFVLHDPLYHPMYWWPRTLLSYPMDFKQSAELDRLVLKHVESDDSVPIQFSNVVRGATGVTRATLNFFSDLPSGGHREFELTMAAAPNTIKPQVSEQRDGNSIILDSGIVRVRIPATQLVTGDAPGPIQQFSRNGKWIGTSTFKVEKDRVVRVTTTRVEQGPLFISYKISYELHGGSTYVAHVHCISGFDFVRLQENMEGMLPGVRGIFECNWTGFHVTHRQAPNHPTPLPPKVLKYEEYPWEKIDAPFYFVIGGDRIPAGQLPFNIGVYQTWSALHTDTSANFWDEKSNDAMCIFIDKPTEWQDHEYANHTEGEPQQIRFIHHNDHFLWQFPIARGSRSTCVGFYDHEKDKHAQHDLDQAAQPIENDGFTYKGGRAFTSYAMFLQNRYNTLDLNNFKDWVLEYPDTAKRAPVIFSVSGVKNPADLETRVLTSEYIGTLPLLGTRENGGVGPIPGRSVANFSPVPSRQIQGGWIDAFNRLSSSMTDRQRKRLTAMYLFVAYIHAGEDFMPLVPMLSGHPNFLADVKATPAAMAFLFPEHPMAAQWADLWQKAVELNTRYNTRPDVKSWNADGGRWTENLGTYVWAFLRPSLRTDFLLRNYDGRERFLTPQLADVADWLVGALSAPFAGESTKAYHDLQTLDDGHEWGAVPPNHAPARIHPPQGAHSERRIPPRSLWYFGTCLQRYSPLIAEHAMWAARPTNQDMETKIDDDGPWNAMFKAKDNLGTKPQLQSRKFTGYGIVLRSAVETPDEVSIHLQQIDQGPNYRWGTAGEGGCGVIYYFANGKAYSSNSAEDVGDRSDQDTDFCTSFGVFKNGVFRSIGMNTLSRPFYNLGMGQFAELIPRQTDTPYSSPEYLSRSLLMAGAEYFVVYDAVLNPALIHRLSWFVRAGDEMPTIKIVRGEGGSARNTNRTEIKTAASTGIWFDGEGDSMVLVTHRKDVDVKAEPFGCRVKAPGIDDLVFRNPTLVEFSEATNSFHGTAGIIRTKNTSIEFALFHGTHIAVQGIAITTDDTELGISGFVAAGQPIAGQYYAPTASSVKITVPSLSDKVVLYIDGEAQNTQRVRSEMIVTLPQGQHRWEIAESLPVPIAPCILRTENHSAGARVILAPVASATRYRVEVSADNGATWNSAANASQPMLDVVGLKNDQKVHLRAIAINSVHESSPSAEYPLYVSDQAPPVPDGLHVDLADGRATVTWGEVLGAGEYKLYTRTKGSRQYSLLYRGVARNYVDKRSGIVACNKIPGADLYAPHQPVYEYAVAAANANGESAMSPAADTDPSSWRNWDPRPGEPFRRVISYDPDTPPSASPWPRYYPQ